MVARSVGRGEKCRSEVNVSMDVRTYLNDDSPTEVTFAIIIEREDL